MKYSKFIVPISVLVLLILPFWGTIPISLFDLFSVDRDPTTSDVFWKIRVPRVLFAFLVGAVLSISGAAYQSMFRNVLVCPFSLGVSSAAALGASVAIATGVATTWGGEAALSAVGALLGIGLVLLLGRFVPRDGNTSLLLCGVVLGFFFSSLIALVQYISDYAQLFRLSRWMLGALQVVGYQEVVIVGCLATLGAVLLTKQSGELNLISLGPELAESKGVSVERTERVVFIVTSLMIGSVVALSGVIGFVGIMVPHMVRAVWGVENQFVLPRSFWLGGVLLAVCDSIGRIIVPPYEVPVGVITALVGGPFFVWLVVKKDT